MFFVISKVLKFLIMPFSWAIGLLIATYFVRKHKGWKRGLFIAAIVILLVFTCRPLLQVAQYQRTKAYATLLPPKPHYKAAIVLGGFGRRMDATTVQFVPFRDRSPRLFEAIRLQRMGVVDKILITGDECIAADKKGNTTAHLFLQYMQQLGIADSSILLEQHARNTRENATFSIAILDSLNIPADSCLLITSASHTSRSLACFQAQGWNVDCYATNIYPKPQGLTWNNYLPSGQTIIDWEELINEYLGEQIYKIVGYN